MKPSALLVTMSRYWGVARRLRAMEARVFPGVDVCTKTVRYFSDIPPLLKSSADFVALDGHGWADNQDAYFGTGKVFTQFSPGYLRGNRGIGIVAPMVVLAFCCGGEDPFPDVLERSIDQSQVAFLGSTSVVDYDDAECIYPPLLSSLAELGPKPRPSTAYARLELIAPTIGATWRPKLLQRRTARYSSRVSLPPGGTAARPNGSSAR